MSVLPKVSVVIPCYNEEKFIGACLDSLLANTYPKDRLTLFVVDGGSTDKTLVILKEYTATHSCIQHLHNPSRFTPRAFNLGIQADDSEVVIILGAHSRVAKDFVSENIAVLQEHPDAMCCGGVVTHLSGDAIAAGIAYAMTSLFGVGNARFRTGGYEGWVDTVGSGAYRRRVFETCGLFDETLVRNQDDELSYRMHKHGMKLYLSPRIKSEYAVRSSYKKLFRQYYQYGFWKVYVNKKHRAVTTLRQLVPAAFVASLLMCLCLMLFNPEMFALPVAAYLLFYLSAGMLASLRAGKYFFTALPAFWVLHLAYGSGYLMGILRLLVLGKEPAPAHTKVTR